MLSAKEAEAIIINLVQPLSGDRDTELVSLLNANQRILATDVKGKVDFPYWDNSAMDGYAVRYQDVADCSTNQPRSLEIIEEIPAGYTPQKSLQAGQAARIFTGAMLPSNADTIVIQENTEREGNQVSILAAPKPKNFVRYQGSYYQAGEVMLNSGSLITAPDIAVLATAQCPEVQVYRRPKVAILSTGDELITPDAQLQPGQIVDSNQYALASLVMSYGAIPIALGIVPDQPEVLKEKISQAINQADIVLSTGGVSVGDYDYVDQILAELGGNIKVRSVAVKPGKPLTVATFEKSGYSSCLYFGIPGNPVSALVSCWRFVIPALKKFSGITANVLPTFVKAIAKNDLKSGGKRETYLWGQLKVVNGEYQFSLAGGGHNSANLINLAQTSGLAVVPIGTKEIKSGSTIMVMQV